MTIKADSRSGISSTPGRAGLARDISMRIEKPDSTTVLCASHKDQAERARGRDATSDRNSGDRSRNWPAFARSPNESRRALCRNKDEGRARPRNRAR